MWAELVKRADAIRQQAKGLEAVKGSGLHDDDRDPVNPGRFAAPQKNGFPRQSEHVVAFFDHGSREEVHFAGPDAEKVMETLTAWRGKPRGEPSLLPGTERKLYFRIIPSLAIVIGSKDQTPRVTIPLRDWNDVLFALQDSGLGVSGAPVVHDGTTP